MSLCTRVSGCARGFCSRLYSAGQYAKAAAQTIPFAIGKIKEAAAESNAPQRALDGSIIGAGTAFALTSHPAMLGGAAAGMVLGAGTATGVSTRMMSALSFTAITVATVGVLTRDVQRWFSSAERVPGEDLRTLGAMAGAYAVVRNAVTSLPRPVQHLAALRFAGGFLMPAATSASAVFGYLPAYLLLNGANLPSTPEAFRIRWYSNIFLTTGISAHAAAAGFAVAGPVGAVAASAASNALLNTASKIVEKRDHYLAPIADAFRQNLNRLQGRPVELG